MNLSALKAEIETDPLTIGYAQYLPASTGLIADALNTVRTNIIVVQEKWLNDRGLASEIIPLHGIAMMDSIFAKFDTASQASLTVKRMVNRLYADEKWLNFGDLALRAMFESWRGTLLTEDEANALLEVAKATSSRAVALFGKNISESDVIKALEL